MAEKGPKKFIYSHQREYICFKCALHEIKECAEGDGYGTPEIAFAYPNTTVKEQDNTCEYCGGPLVTDEDEPVERNTPVEDVSLDDYLD